MMTSQEAGTMPASCKHLELVVLDLSAVKRESSARLRANRRVKVVVYCMWPHCAADIGEDDSEYAEAVI